MSTAKLPPWLTGPNHPVTLDDGSELAQLFARNYRQFNVQWTIPLTAICFIVAFVKVMKIIGLTTIIEVPISTIIMCFIGLLAILLYVLFTLKKKAPYRSMLDNGLLQFCPSVDKRNISKIVDLYLAGYSGRDFSLDLAFTHRLQWLSNSRKIQALVIFLPLMMLSLDFSFVQLFCIGLLWSAFVGVTFSKWLYIQSLNALHGAEPSISKSLSKRNFWRKAARPYRKHQDGKRSTSLFSLFQFLHSPLFILPLISSFPHTLIFLPVLPLLFLWAGFAGILFYTYVFYRRLENEALQHFLDSSEKMDQLFEAYILSHLHGGRRP